MTLFIYEKRDEQACTKILATDQHTPYVFLKLTATL